MAVVEKVSRLLQALPICRKKAVVALSGGSDSVALLIVAKQLFGRITAVTVDHRTREGSEEEAARAESIANSLGVDHVTLTLDWPKVTSKQQKALRDARYHALLGHCKALDFKTLLVGHHMDDQLETFINRLGNESGLLGLRCMNNISSRVGHLDVRIVRPFLDISKEELRTVCSEQAVEWIEDESNANDKYYRNRVRKVLANQEWLKPHVLQLLNSAQYIGRDVDRQTDHALHRVVSIEHNLGLARINFPLFQALPALVGKRVLTLVANHIAGVVSNNVKNFNQLHERLLSSSKLPTSSASLSHCVVSPDAKTNSLLVTRQMPPTNQRNLTALHPDRTVSWDNRFSITVSKTSQDRHTSPFKSLYARHMLPSDHVLAKKGFKRNKSSDRVPPLVSRGGLPVIVDGNGGNVAVPHLGYFDLTYGLRCNVTFNSAVPLTHNLDI